MKRNGKQKNNWEIEKNYLEVESKYKLGKSGKSIENLGSQQKHNRSVTKYVGNSQ